MIPLYIFGSRQDPDSDSIRLGGNGFSTLFEEDPGSLAYSPFQESEYGGGNSDLDFWRNLSF